MRDEDSYQHFQETIFAELDALDSIDKQSFVADLVKRGTTVGIDVCAEVLDGHRPYREVMAEIDQKIAKLKKSD